MAEERVAVVRADDADVRSRKPLPAYIVRLLINYIS
jgi:hypothetical protein